MAPIKILAWQHGAGPQTFITKQNGTNAIKTSLHHKLKKKTPLEDPNPNLQNLHQLIQSDNRKNLHF
jgi:hypothetical protein